MRRWISVFLLIFLPVQFVWAGVGAYVGHAEGTQTFHFGSAAHSHDAEHAHSHPGHAAPESGLDRLSAGDRHDCASPHTDGRCHDDSGCHDAHAHFYSLPGADATPDPVVTAHPVPHARHAHVVSAPTPRPERPNWLVLAAPAS
jgi:hypothetical protein